jgi:hypothetical protein
MDSGESGLGGTASAASDKSFETSGVTANVSTASIAGNSNSATA